MATPATDAPTMMSTISVVLLVFEALDWGNGILTFVDVGSMDVVLVTVPFTTSGNGLSVAGLMFNVSDVGVAGVAVVVIDVDDV